MRRSNYLSALDSALLQSIAFYIVLAIFLLPYYQYQINPDGISYINIAQKYLLGDFHNAINGCWGPLLSWLLLPFLVAGIKPLLAVKLLSLTIGIVTLFHLNSLMDIVKITGFLRNAVLYLMALIVIYFALWVTTPDLLLVCLIIPYLNTILDESHRNSKYAGVICGLLGSALYLTKSYGFPFFVAHFSIINFFLFIRDGDRYERINIVKRFMSGMVVFFLISASWIYVISNKYNQLTIGTAGGYNHALVGPQSPGHPMHFRGLLDPPNSTAISVWEDPSYLKNKDWKVFDSISTIKHQIKNIRKNIREIKHILKYFSPLAMWLLLISIIYCLQRGKQILFDKIFLLLITIIILISGYTLMRVEERYIWLANILIIVIGAKLSSLLFEKYPQRKIPLVILTIIFIVSFSKGPTKSLRSSLYTGKDTYDLNNKINQFAIKGRIASNTNWHRSLYLSFYNGWQYYGERGNLGKLELENALKDKMIDYFLIWEPFDKEIEYSEKYEEITDGKIDGLKIYRLESDRKQED